MIHPFEHELSRPLAALLRNMGQVPQDATDAAQQRLIKRLNHGHPVHRRARLPVRWFAVSVTIMLALLVALFVPTHRGGDAFAAVLKHFRNFHTLTMTIVQRAGERTLQTSRTVVNAQGVLRTDVGTQLSVIVDPPRGRVLTLLHEPRQAMLMRIPEQTDALADSMQWLEDLRRFEGKATPLSATRMINGHVAHGWLLNVNGLDMEIMADPSGLPLSMRQLNAAGGIEIDYRFEFNRPLAPDELSSSPPTNYSLLKPETN